MKRVVDLVPYFGRAISPDKGQARFDALPHGKRLRLAILRAFAEHNNLQPPKKGPDERTGDI